MDSSGQRSIESMVDGSGLQPFLVRQRWFGGKARTVATVRIVDSIAISNAAWLTIVEVHFEDGACDRYVVPLAVALGDDAVALRSQRPEAVVVTPSADVTVYDGVFDDGLCMALLMLVRGESETVAAGGRLLGTRVTMAPDDGLKQLMPVSRSAPDQSNTSVIFGSVLIMKIFRRIEPGQNPDVELSAFLTRRGFTHMPAMVGTVSYRHDGQPPAAVLMVQRYVPNRGNGWTVTLDALSAYFAATDGEPRTGRSRRQMMADRVLPQLLGRRTGELHLQLASAEGKDLMAEANSIEQLQRTAAMMRERGRDQLQLLQRSLSQLVGEVHRHAEQVLTEGETLLGRFEELAQLGDGGLRIRCHGDYHLGQTLVTDDDILILDFEGEPARPLEERRARWSPAKDVAGMLRSFSYAAASGLRAAIEDGRKDPGALAARADDWERTAHAAFLGSYLAVTASSPILPAADAATDTLLRAFVIDKALYELGYELNNRPDWVDIPLNALLRLSGTDAPWRRS